MTTLNVLFLCTGNSARSIMAEALLNTLGGDRFRAFSAGSRPAGQVNPYAAVIARQLGYPPSALRSKSWDEFSGPDAPNMDIVVTVCDNAAGEACPLWPGQPLRAHWGFRDPAAAQGTPVAIEKEFARACEQIRQHIRRLLALPLVSLDRAAQQQALHAIGDPS